MDLSKMIGYATVMASQPNISIPAGCKFEMAGAFGQALKALILIDLDGHTQRWDPQPPKAAV